MYVAVSIDSAITEPFQFIEDLCAISSGARGWGWARGYFWRGSQGSDGGGRSGAHERARGVRLGEIVSTLRSDNFSLAGGYCARRHKEILRAVTGAVCHAAGN